MPGKIDVEDLKARLLDRAESLVEDWLPKGKKQGRYWKFGDVTGEPGNSAWVHLDKGNWRDEAVGGESGGDLISLYAAVRCNGDQGQAIKELAELMGLAPLTPRQAAHKPAKAPAAKRAAKKKEGPEWMPLHPVPDDAPDYRTQWAHYARGIPKRHWEYRDREGRLLGLVCRFEASDGSKDVQPLSFCQGSHGPRQWRYHGFVEPRPLYGLDRLPDLVVEHPQLVVIVEGEKCADALWEALGRAIPVLAWPGGGKAVKKAEWSVLAGFRVVCWPDADSKVDKRTQQLYPFEDQPGMVAMRQVEAILVDQHQTPVRIVDTGPVAVRPDGWDCADAIEEGWTREQLLQFMRNLLPPRDSVSPAAAGEGGKGASTPPPAARAEEVEPDWRGRLIWRNEWQLRECVPNVIEVLQHHPKWKGVIGFDEFAHRVVKRKPAPFDLVGVALVSDEWTDVDDTRAAAWIAQNERFVPSSAMVAEAVNVVARCNSFHPVREYLATLQWDGTPRIDHWLIDFLHVKDTPYVRLVSRWFLIGMVMRVLQPGCKFDYCLVLEGHQGRMKSSALRVLGGEWFSDIELDLANKDSMSNIRGKWLHEFGEMGSIARAESTRQKSFLSRQVDEFRPSYGRREIRCPRQLAFAGTTNEWQWNKDPTGGRRFWPAEVTDEIDIEGLRNVRDQLFAEAYHLALAGERYWPLAAEQRELFDPEQLAREQPEAYVEILARWLDTPDAMGSKPGDKEFTLSDAILHGLRIDAKGITRDVQTRVGTALAKLGCEKVEYRTREIRHWYKRPQRNAASSMPDAPRFTYEGEGLPV